MSHEPVRDQNFDPMTPIPQPVEHAPSPVTLEKGRIWFRDGTAWFCDAYDHGPFCRQCRPLSKVRTDEQLHELIKQKNNEVAATS